MASAVNEPPTMNSDSMNKYTMSSTIVKNVLSEVIKKCVAGAKIYDICRFGDTRICEETAKQFASKKSMRKGLAFPTTISVNNIICHYSPMENDKEGPEVINENDLVKIDIGAHLDGYAVFVGHSLVVGATPKTPVNDRKADAIIAANKALDCALRFMKPGVKNMEITEIITRVAQEYKCCPIRGIQSHVTRQFEYDTEKGIVLYPTEDQRKKVEPCVLEANEVWVLDIVISTGEGKAREFSGRPNIFKRNEAIYQLKLAAARKLYSEVGNKYESFPFHISALEDQNKSRFALMECKQHGNIEELQVFEEKENEFVAQAKATIIITDQGPIRLSGTFDASSYTSQHKITDPELGKILLQPIKSKSS